MYYIYILISLKDDRTYTGFCKDITERIKIHNSGKVKATQHRTPFRVVYTERAKTIKMAKHREKYWKSGAGRRKLKSFFKKGFPPIQKF